MWYIKICRLEHNRVGDSGRGCNKGFFYYIKDPTKIYKSARQYRSKTHSIFINQFTQEQLSILAREVVDYIHFFGINGAIQVEDSNDESILTNRYGEGEAMTIFRFICLCIGVAVFISLLIEWILGIEIIPS